MKRIAIIAALALAAPAFAQQAQPSIIEQVDAAVSAERSAGNTALLIKEQRIAELLKQIEQLKKDAEACKPKPEAKK